MCPPELLSDTTVRVSSEPDPQTTTALWINGVVGVGKTTAASARLLESESVPHALIDLDELRRLHPPPVGDPFAEEVGLRNLRAMWANYRAVGARYLIVVGVIENAADRERKHAALGGAALTVIRLRARPAVVAARLRRRPHRGSLPWHLQRAEELSGVLERAALDDGVIDCDDLDAEATAFALRRLWPPADTKVPCG